MVVVRMSVWVLDQNYRLASLAIEGFYIRVTLCLRYRITGGRTTAGPGSAWEVQFFTDYVTFNTNNRKGLIWHRRAYLSPEFCRNATHFP